jgi:BolA protein
MIEPSSTAAAPVPLAVEIENRLNSALSPTRLDVSNDSAQHAGHMGDDGTGESHFSVTIEAPAFAGVSRVQRQRLVNQALADLLRDRIHALAIRATAPGE